MSDCNNHIDASYISNHRSHAIRDLFRTSDDSSSSDDNDDDNINDDADDSEGDDDTPRFRSIPNEQQSIKLTPTHNNTITNTIGSSTKVSTTATSTSTTTMIRRIQNVEIEVCTIGGSIEHRLWPAAEFLVSYILSPPLPQPQQQQQRHDETTTSIPFLNQQRHKHSNTNFDTNAINHEIYQNVNEILNHFRASTSTRSSTTTTTAVKVLELGAGVGFTSLQLAYNIYSNQNNYNTNNHHNSKVQFLLTDLLSALPLLQRNVDRNLDRIFDNNNIVNCNNSNNTISHNKNDTIKVQKLEWGNVHDIQQALYWYNNDNKNNYNSKMEQRNNDDTPLLILGSDCVYWESLYNILESTIASLLQNASSNSICLLANVRRWKRDTNFFQHQFGPHTSTKHGQLHCICIHEQVTREYNRTNGTGNSTTLNFDQCKNNTTIASQNHQRQIIRIYAIKWISK